MKLGIVLSTNNAETSWNALRLANFALGEGDEVKIFLVGEGVEYEKGSSEKFNIEEQAEKFIHSERSDILACGTCIKSRQQEETATCPISSLKDLYELVKESDKVVSF